MALKKKNVDLQTIIRGTLIKRFAKCGDKKCGCHMGEKVHGPNWYIVYSENKKTRHIYVSKSDVKTARQYIENYNRLWEQIIECSKENIRRIKGSVENDK